MTNHKGFTLLELFVTIGIAGVLLAIAVPTFNESIARSRITSNANLLVGALNYARAEAVDRGAQVTVQPFGVGGFEVVSGGEQLKVFQPSSNNITITTAAANVIYLPTGLRPVGSSAVSLLIEDTDKGHRRRVCVSIAGGIKVTEGGAC